MTSYAGCTLRASSPLALGALLYFDDDMTSTAGAVRVLVMPEVTQPDQLAAYAFETFYTF